MTKESSTITIVGVSNEAKKKLKTLAKSNKKTMGDTFSEIVLNYDPEQKNPLKETTDRIEIALDRFDTFLSQKPRWKIW